MIILNEVASKQKEELNLRNSVNGPKAEVGARPPRGPQEHLGENFLLGVGLMLADGLRTLFHIITGSRLKLSFGHFLH